MPLTRRVMMTLALAAPLGSLCVLPARAQSPVFYAPDGIAVSGYDPVSYFSGGSPQTGDKAYALKWHGAVWYFSSEDNRTAFEMRPWAYAPQFGGYCAFAASKGDLASGDPKAFLVLDGKLYLINSPAVLKIWARERDANIARAEANWPSILGY